MSSDRSSDTHAYMQHAIPLASDFLCQKMLAFAQALNIPIVLHRKIWEFAFITHHLDRLDMLRSGRQGLVFGVGTEKLPALYAARGCTIVATDGPIGAAWADTGQYTTSTEPLFDPVVCDRDTFDKQVRFAICDMNGIPSHLRGFDFCWSASVLEHLGDLEAGLRFIENSLDCLLPGGVAVHVLEYNLSSNDQTTTKGDTCLYRQRDIDDLSGRLSAKGWRLERLPIVQGSSYADQHVCCPPFERDSQRIHLKIKLTDFASTSYGIVIRR
jgi:hypothetical protein